MGLGAKKTRTKTRRFTRYVHPSTMFSISSIPSSTLTTLPLFRGVDQSKSDLLDARHLEIYKETKLVEDLPSLGEWYCIECSRWFDRESTLVGHKRGKPHKRRLVILPRLWLQGHFY